VILGVIVSTTLPLINDIIYTTSGATAVELIINGRLTSWNPPVLIPLMIRVPVTAAVGVPDIEPFKLSKVKPAGKGILVGARRYFLIAPPAVRFKLVEDWC